MTALSTKTVTFSGMLTPCSGCSSLGSEINLCLVGSRDTELFIEDNTPEQSLREYVYERVIVAGSLCQKSGTEYLKVDRFEYLPEEDEYSDGPWDHDEY